MKGQSGPPLARTISRSCFFFVRCTFSFFTTSIFFVSFFYFFGFRYFCFDLATFSLPPLLFSLSLFFFYFLLTKKLRDSNDELRAEVLALRTYMLQRGFTPVEDIFADPSPQKPTALLSPTISPTATRADRSPSQPTLITPPPPPLPREARLAALALLWAAAISVGGIFVPIAIREGAEQSLRWLDGGGSLIPAPTRRAFGGYRGRWRGKGWGDAVLSYVPVLARARKVAHDGRVGEEEVELQAEGLAGAWDELKPQRRRRRRAP